jgi:hypothetical protein
LETLHEVHEEFDAVTCIGNSLSLLPDAGTVRTVIQEIGRIVTGGGVCVVHVLNLQRLADGPILWQKARRVSLEDAEHVIVKGVHRSGQRGFVDMAVIALNSGDLNAQCSSTPLLALDAEVLCRDFEQAGFESTECFGSYDRAPFVRDSSPDLILVARKGG